jgi:nitrite reductase (NO-forming)
MFGVVAAAALAWALPAFAHPAKTSATVVNVVAGKPSEFKYTFSVKTYKTGSYTFKLTDSGTLPHDIKICSSNKGGTGNTCAGTGSTTISPGGSTSVTFNFKTPGTYEYLCTLPGHAAAGMKGDLKVT